MGWAAAVFAIAGPTWQREPAPFADDTAALAIVVKVAPSMKTEDLPPDRLARATEKIHDLLAIRAEAKTALIAYAGTAHLVMPATTDGGIINTFAAALDPKVMPTEGDAAAAAFRLADQALRDPGNGSILWITDSVAPEQSSDLATWRKASRTRVQLLPPLLPGPELDALKSAAAVVEAALVNVTADDADVRALARSAKFSAVASGQLSDRWQESGYWLTPLLGVAVLPFFRRGWMISSGGKA
jgi:Ca-activated chloride channel family protein